MGLANLVAAALFFGPFVGGKIDRLAMLVGSSFFCFAFDLPTLENEIFLAVNKKGGGQPA